MEHASGAADAYATGSAAASDRRRTSQLAGEHAPPAPCYIQWFSQIKAFALES